MGQNNVTSPPFEKSGLSCPPPLTLRFRRLCPRCCATNAKFRSLAVKALAVYTGKHIFEDNILFALLEVLRNLRNKIATFQRRNVTVIG